MEVYMDSRVEEILKEKVGEPYEEVPAMSRVEILLKELNGGVDPSTYASILSDTTANWNAQKKLISRKDILYVYTDYRTVDGENIPGLKVGDGNAYLIDLPFVGISSITEEERQKWNEKVALEEPSGGSETLIFFN